MDSLNGYNSNGGDHPEVAPSFLFGSRTQKRKSLALGGGRPTQPFGSPGILKKELSIASPGAKNVRWSSDLVQEQSIPGKPAASPVIPQSFHSMASSPWSNGPNSFLKGPPLRSITADDAVEPPSKLQRPDLTLEGRESAIEAINGAVNAFNNIVGEPDDYWVTVFGFTAEDREMVLNVFSRHGNIVSHKIPRVGNWIHVRYSSILHAQQALKRDGNTIADRLMIGVVKCTDRETVEEKMMNPLNASSSHFTDVSFGSPVLQSTMKGATINGDESINGSRPSLSFTDASSFNRSRLSALSRSGMRSLRAAEADISLDSSNRKDGSFLSKFWNFVAPQ